MSSGLVAELIAHIPLEERISRPPHSKRKRIVILSGPTAVGKSEIALLVAEAMGGEIVSADSMQVYRGMDIGTAKVSQGRRQQVPHHLIDCRDLGQGFNVVDFYYGAMQAIDDILRREAVPIVVGGTGFYIHALLYGPPSGPPSIPDLRKKLETEAGEKGTAVLYQRLKELDPEYARSITGQDRQKIVRALEIISLAQERVSQFSNGSMAHAAQYDFRCWFLYLPREILYPQIEKRCERMLAEGLVEEVTRLKKQGLIGNRSAAQAIGYRQCIEYLDSPQSQEDWDHFSLTFKQASRRYAKRQFTWFRKEPLFRWLNMHAMARDEVVEMIVQDYELSS